MPPKLKLPRFVRDADAAAGAELPLAEVRFLDAVYRDANEGAKPRALREDFCGAFANCCAWVKLGPERVAVGVDPDPDPAQIAYGCAHYRARLKPSELVRVRVVRDDLLGAGLPKADMIASLGFSHFVLKTRVELLGYLRNCLRTLEPGGVLVLDCFGGPEVQQPHEEPREETAGTYIVEQDGFDPMTHEAVFRVHLKRRGDIKRRQVATYDWRMWTVPELKEALLDAGFAAVRIYWRGESDGDGAHDFVPVERVQEEPGSWTSYVVGFR